MKKKLLFISVYLAFFIGKSYSQTLFMREYGGGFSNHSVKLIKTLDGQLLMAGYIYDSGGYTHMYLIKVSESGNAIWSHAFDNTFSKLSDIYANPDGSYSAVGILGDTLFNYYSVRSAYLSQLDSQGYLSLTKTFADGLTFFDAQGISVNRTTDNGFLMTIVADSVFNSSRYHALRLDSTGAIIWSKKITLGSSDYPSDAFQLSDGNYLFAGTTTTSSLDHAPFIMKMDTAGNVLWIKRFVTVSSYIRTPNIIETNDSGLLLSTTDGTLIKTDSMGLIQWAINYDSNLDPALYEIVKDSSNSYVINTLFGLLKVDSTGLVLWQKEYFSICYAPYFTALSVVQHVNGYLYLLSKSWPTVNTSAFNLSKIDLDGGLCCENNFNTIPMPVNILVDTPAVTVAPYTWTVGTKNLSPRNTNSSGFNICAGVIVEEHSVFEEIQVAPNPTNTLFKITSPQSPIIRTEIHNLLGEKIYSAISGNESLTVNCEAFPKGIYIANIATEMGTAVRKLVVQ